MYKHYNKGFIEVICGPMFASKTETLLSRINNFKYAKQDYWVFKPKVDNRYSKTDIVSHSGISIPCNTVENSKDLLDKVISDMMEIDAVIIDEVQFFDEGIIEVAEFLANRGIRVIVAGLDMDFKGDPFPIVSELLARAEMVTKLTAVCVVCGSAATRSQRLVDGKPAPMDDDVVFVGADTYEARCRKHHEVDIDEST